MARPYFFMLHKLSILHFTCLFCKHSGTTKIKHVDDNVISLKVKLTAEDLKEITDAVAINEVAGARIHAGIELSSWRFVNTPSKSDNASEQDS